MNLFLLKQPWPWPQVWMLFWVVIYLPHFSRPASHFTEGCLLAVTYWIHDLNFTGNTWVPFGLKAIPYCPAELCEQPNGLSAACSCISMHFWVCVCFGWLRSPRKPYIMYYGNTQNDLQCKVFRRSFQRQRIHPGRRERWMHRTAFLRGWWGCSYTDWTSLSAWWGKDVWWLTELLM